MAVTHLIREYPLTLCGVDVEEKSGAIWTLDPEEEEITCRNCLKLHSGQPMGKGTGPIKTEIEVMEDLERIKVSERIGNMDYIRSKVQALMMDVRVLMGGFLSPEEKTELSDAEYYLEGAEVRIEWARDRVKEVLRGLNPRRDEEGLNGA